MASKNTTIAMTQQTNNNTGLSTPLIGNKMDEKQFTECLKPLQYILFPIGITNLFSDYKPNIFLKTWSFIFPLSLLLIPLYTLNLNTDAWLVAIDALGNNVQSIVLRICFIDHQFTSIGTYLFLRFYFFPQQRPHKLLRDLYKFIDNAIIATKQYENNCFQTYYNTIHKYIKLLCICCCVLQGSLIIIWTTIDIISMHTTNVFSYLKPVIFCWQVYWVWFVIVVIFLIIIKILTLYYYIYTSKIYYAFSIHQTSNDIIDMNDLQHVFNDKYNENKQLVNVNNDIMTVYDMKNEYVKMVRLFSKNAKYWNVPFMIGIVSAIAQ
eukprot:535655_1